MSPLELEVRGVLGQGVQGLAFSLSEMRVVVGGWQGIDRQIFIGFQALRPDGTLIWAQDPAGNLSLNQETRVLKSWGSPGRVTTALAPSPW